MQYEELLELVKSRRTIRAIKPDPVPDEIGREGARGGPLGADAASTCSRPSSWCSRTWSSRGASRRSSTTGSTSDFYALEATREPWQGPPWTLENRGRVACPLAPVYILILGDTRRRAGLPMNARYCMQKGDSIFESSLANAFMYLWLAAHSLGLAAQPVSAVKNERVQGLVKHLLNLPDFIYVYELLAVGYSGLEGGAAGQADAAPRRDRARGTGGGRRVPERRGAAEADPQAADGQRGPSRAADGAEVERRRIGGRRPVRSQQRDASYRGVAAMAYEFKFPDIGEGITEGELLSWKVKEGDQVAAGPDPGRDGDRQGRGRDAVAPGGTGAEAARGRGGHRQRGRRAGDHRGGGACRAAAAAPAPAPRRAAAARPPAGRYASRAAPAAPPRHRLRPRRR